MSLFHTSQIPCPSCGQDVEFEVVASVNAVRRPDLRQAILDGTFQQQTCGHCGTNFRVQPEFNYLDVSRGQWIAAFPYEKLGEWPRHEEHTRATIDKAYGPRASAPARSIGARLKLRLTFGWAALREKLVAAEAGLDDVVLELCKIAILHGAPDQPLADETELRLFAVDGPDLVLAWIVTVTERVVDTMKVPRSLYDEIAADLEAWQELRAELSAGMFVDSQRLMIASA